MDKQLGKASSVCVKARQRVVVEHLEGVGKETPRLLLGGGKVSQVVVVLQPVLRVQQRLKDDNVLVGNESCSVRAKRR